MDLSWEKEFAAQSEIAQELLAEIYIICHRENIPYNARPIVKKLLRLKMEIETARAKALANENISSDEAKEVSEVRVQSTSVSYLTSDKNIYSNQAKAARAHNALEEEYNALFKKLVFSIRKFPCVRGRSDD